MNKHSHLHSEVEELYLGAGVLTYVAYDALE